MTIPRSHSEKANQGCVNTHTCRSNEAVQLPHIRHRYGTGVSYHARAIGLV